MAAKMLNHPLRGASQGDSKDLCAVWTDRTQGSLIRSREHVHTGLQLFRGGRAGLATLRGPGQERGHSPSAGHQQRPSACSTWLWPMRTRWWRGR